MNAVVKTVPQPANSVLMRMASRFGVDPDKMLSTLKATAFRGDVSNEQMMALLIVAEQYRLNPWTKEIYAFPSRTGIVPVVSVDGWARIINEQEACNGIQFKEADDGAWIECTIYRKDREYPTAAREWLSECRRDTDPWRSHPRRMLRHKSLIQCARIVFGFAGIYDQDEAERIIEVTPVSNPRAALTEGVDNELRDKHVSAIADILAADKEEADIAQMLRDYETEYLQPFHELYIAVQDKLSADGIISKANFKKYLKIGMDRK